MGQAAARSGYKEVLQADNSEEARGFVAIRYRHARQGPTREAVPGQPSAHINLPQSPFKVHILGTAKLSQK